MSKMALANLLSAITLLGVTLAPLTMAQNSHQDFVNAHNAARARVGVGPVSWNYTLAAYAQTYANKKIGTCELQHSYGPYGENLSEGYGEMTAVEAVNFWVSEKKYYDHRSNRCVGDECRHYTQVVWRDTKHVGCARVKCHNNWIFVICNYDPPGNYQGQFPY
ncbi:basic form of pathogenesis-related protein 1-like [Momordica charantia]|uniref:Basic form of pathogenesis-related protein 1-like n=1 Tax=Momordica charantia TaxID=3673 RepID=A0A6J1DWC8_MOMCH|nr:basic form of pathogenesis-related protein 1-like [Momordica charantia]